jgi:hypothetical protein
MLRSVVSKVMWVGRATIFMVGLAVVLFLTLAIVAQAADAARVPALKKGVVNTVKSMTTLVGTLSDPILKLQNNGAGTALQLEVGANQPPLVVNADAGTATNLDADQLDGKDESAFLGKTEKAANSELLDGQEASAFLAANGKAQDADLLDGKNSTAFVEQGDVLYATVLAAGGVFSGASTPGTTASRSATGTYTVTFPNITAGNCAFTYGLESGSSFGFIRSTLDGNTLNVFTANANGTLTDQTFNVIARCP